MSTATNANMTSVPVVTHAGVDTAGLAEKGAIRKVIEAQIGAFRADDGERAFGYASPNIRQIFRSAENFMAMVRNGYQPVYRPRSVRFGDLVEVETTQEIGRAHV